MQMVLYPTCSGWLYIFKQKLSSFFLLFFFFHNNFQVLPVVSVGPPEGPLGRPQSVIRP